MANELSIQTNFSYNKASINLVANSTSTISVTGTNIIQSTQLIATTATQVKFGQDMAVTAVGTVMIQNVDATNFVDIDFNGDLTFPIRLYPATSTSVLGGSFLACLNSAVTAVTAKANTAACNILVYGVER